MHRRTFLTSTLAGVGAAALASDVSAQAPAAPARPSGDIPAAAVAAGQGPAPVAKEKIARIGIMTLDYNSVLKLPWDTTNTPAKTLAVLDLPQYLRDNYGVSNVEFQNSHLAQGTSDPDPAFIKEMRAKLDAAGVRANQINLEIGAITQLSTAEARETWLVRARKWADAAPILGATRLLINQTGLSDANKADAIAAWKAFQDYAKPKGIKISAENRPFSSTAYGPPADYPDRARTVWGLIAGMRGSVRGVYQHRLRADRSFSQPAGTPRRDPRHDEDQFRQRAREDEPALGSRHGGEIYRVTRLQGPVHDRSRLRSRRPRRLQRRARERLVALSIACRARRSRRSRETPRRSAAAV